MPKRRSKRSNKGAKPKGPLSNPRFESFYRSQRIAWLPVSAGTGAPAAVAAPAPEAPATAATPADGAAPPAPAQAPTPRDATDDIFDTLRKPLPCS